MSRTHATSPQWTKHARFHVVWQTISIFIFSATEAAVIWWPGPNIEQRFYLAAILTGFPMVGFWGAFVSRKVYGGALSDPNSIPPLRIAISTGSLRIDLNLAAEVAACIMLGAIVAIYNR